MQPPTGNPTFYRGSDRILGGVCSGLAEGFHVEALWVRLAFVVLAFLQGIGVLLYVVLWILMPERAGYRPPGQNVFESMGSDMKRAWTDLRHQFGAASTATSSTAAAPPSAPGEASAAGEPAPAASSPAQPVTRNASFIFGAILIVIGIAFLAANTGFVDWSVLWPAALVALRVGLLIRNMERRS